MMACLKQKIKNHNPHYICLLLQNVIVRQVQDHKIYHSEPSLSHHIVGVTTPDVSSTPSYIQVSL